MNRQDPVEVAMWMVIAFVLTVLVLIVVYIFN